MVLGALARRMRGTHNQVLGSSARPQKLKAVPRDGERNWLRFSIPSVILIGTLLVLFVGGSAPVAAASTADSTVQFDQHDPINLTVYATGDEVTDGEEYIKRKNPEVTIEVTSSELIETVVIRANGERRYAFHPNSTSFTKTKIIDTVNSWNDITVVVRTESGAVRSVKFRWLKDIRPPQLVSSEGGWDNLNETEDDDQDDSFVNGFLNTSATDRFVFNRSSGTVAFEFSDVDKVEHIKIENTWTGGFSCSGNDACNTVKHNSTPIRTGEDTFLFSRQIYLAPTMGGTTVENTITVDVWDRIGNHESYNFTARVDDDRAPNASLSIDSFINEPDPEGDRSVSVDCIDRDERFNNTSGNYYDGKYDGVPDCDEFTNNTNSSSTLSWLRNVSDDTVARMPSNFVRMNGFVEDETRVRKLTYDVRYIKQTSSENCNEINDSLDQIQRSDFDEEDQQLTSDTDLDRLEYGNLTCGDLSDSVLRTLDQDDFSNVSDSQWDRFTGGTELTDLREGVFLRDSQTGSGDGPLRSATINEQLLLKQARDRRVRHVINLTATDWSGHDTRLSAVIESGQIETNTEDPMITIRASQGPEPLTINVTGAVTNGTVNSVSVETVADANQTILSHVDVYDGENTRDPLLINQTLPRVEGPTTIIVRANDSEGQTHVKQLGLRRQTEDDQVVTRTPTPTPTPGSPTPAGTTDTPTQTPTSRPETSTPEETPSPTPGSTPVPGIAGDITALAGPGFGVLGAVLALIATLVLLSRRQD